MIDEKMMQEQANEALVEEGFKGLIDVYLASKHRRKVDLITKAFTFAKQAHKGVKRRSGEPYIMHPISVARIACEEIGLGSTSICAALLHDVVEDTDYTVEDIENLFGPKIANIVDGLTKISGGIFGDRASAQTENLKKLLLTMSSDIRVILLKIADRLHNMRTLGSMLPNKQYKIAGETLYIYAPLAYKLGLNKIKSELEDLSFSYEHPEEHAQIKAKLKESNAEREELFSTFVAPIRQKLDKMGLEYELFARVKSPYSIWKKMQSKHISFDEIYDILAVRIVFKTNTLEEEFKECFNIYATISRVYKPHPERFRDWVNHPKANGYQALHATLMSQKGQWIEVQIRSQRMNDIAEQGFAAHWKYKESGIGGEDEKELEHWLNSIKEILESPEPDALDFLDTIKLNLFSSEIFVFTPKGEIKTMPQDCTALDFAFSIHTALGNHCIGAKVNHKLVPLSHKLQSGDQVEILSSKSQIVQPGWMEFVTTAKAKTKIIAALKREKKLLFQQGEEMLRSFCLSEKIEYNSDTVLKLCTLYHYATEEDLFTAIATKKILPGEIDRSELKVKDSTKNWKRIITFGLIGNNSTKEEAKTADTPIDKKKVLKITPEDSTTKYSIAACCKPIPGDDVLGFIDDNKRVIIHKRQCTVATKLKNSYGNHILAVQWESGLSTHFPVNLYFKGIDKLGLLNKVTQIISEQLNVNIRKLSIETEEGLFEGRVQLFVHDVKDVKMVIINLKKIEEVKIVIRIENYEDHPSL
ncbi:MAG: RelA/SpoT family protein [Phocaeicola sp.]